MAAFSISATTPVWQASATEPNTGMSATVIGRDDQPPALVEDGYDA